MEDNGQNLIEQRRTGITVVELKWIKRGDVLASVDLDIEAIGFRLHGCTWGRTNDKDWIGLPRSSWITRDGKRQYTKTITLRRDVDYRFQTAALTAIREYLAALNSEAP